MSAGSSRSVAPYLWMLLGSLSFAGMAALARHLQGSLDWQMIAATRAALACVFALILALGAGATLVFWHPRILWARSVAGSVSMVCSFYAFHHFNLSEVMALVNTFPIWVAVLSWPLLGEMPSLSTCVSVALGMAGISLVALGMHGSVPETPPTLIANELAVVVPLVGAMATAVAMMGLNRLAHIDPRAVVAHFSGVATAFCVASFFIFERDPGVPNVLNGYVIALLIAVGMAATLGQLCLTKAFTTGAPAKVSVVGLTQIVFGMGFDVLLLSRKSFALPTVVGILLITAPTAWLLLQRGEPVLPPPADAPDA